MTMPRTADPDKPLDQFPLQGRVALVTGGARRVGRAVAVALAGEGMDVAITYRRSGREARQVAARIEGMGRRCLLIRADLSRPEAADRVRDALSRRFDSLYALVNNAAVFAPTPLEKLTAAELGRQFAVNAWAPLLLVSRLAPLLRAAGRVGAPARVVNFVDAHVLGQPMRRHLAYGASKGALLEITRMLAAELAPRVTVNAIAPGVIDWAEGFSAGQRRAYLRRVPLGRAGTPADAAAAVVFLVRDAAYCTGLVLALDGGRLLT
jgi:pteridine reductase